jgi:glycosyltransferase involved in cell wall biosynthesis
MKLSIVIPAHNEEQRLPAMLEAYGAFFAELYGESVELIIVPNFCSDRTAEVAHGLAARFPQIQVLADPGRVGKGGAVMLGCKAAKGELIGFVDADGATPPEAFNDLVDRIGSAGCIIASRWIKGAVVEPKQPLSRRIASRIFNMMVNLMFGFRVHDTQCGAKLFRREVLDLILPQLGITRWAFDVDMLFHVRLAGYRITEIPTVWRDAAGSKLQVAKASCDMVLALIRLRLVYSPFKWVVTLYNRIKAKLRKIKLLEKIRKDDLLGHASILFSGMMVVHVCNMVFQMAVSRALSKQEYALLAAFLGALTIVQRPGLTISAAMSHYSSLLKHEGRIGDVKRLIYKWLVLTGAGAVLLGVCCVVFSGSLALFFHMSREAPVLIAAAVLPALFCSPVLGGACQGLQLFKWVATANVSNTVMRLIFGAGFVWFLYPACGWAMLGHGLGLYVAMGVMVLCLFSALHGKKSPSARLPSLRFYLLQSFIIQISAAVLVTGDIVLVKHYLPEDTDFAFAATLGRMVSSFAAVIPMSMFPKVSSARVFTLSHRNIYLRALVYSGAFSGAVFLICFLFPELLHRFIFKITEPTDSLVRMTRWMGAIMMLSTFLTINLSLLMAQRRFIGAAPVVIMAIAYILSARFFHGSSMHIVYAAGLSNLIALIFTMVLVLRIKPELSVSS